MVVANKFKDKQIISAVNFFKTKWGEYFEVK